MNPGAAPQWSATLRWPAGDANQRRARIVLPNGWDVDHGAVRLPPTLGIVRINQTGIDCSALIRGIDGASTIGPFALPAVFAVETPIDLVVTPNRASSGPGSVTIAATPGTGSILPVQRLSVDLADGTAFNLDDWSRFAVVHAAGATGQWIDSAGVVIATFAGGNLVPAVRPSVAAAIRPNGAASLVTLLW